jgi:hypothetical protein
MKLAEFRATSSTSQETTPAAPQTTPITDEELARNNLYDQMLEADDVDNITQEPKPIPRIEAFLEKCY